MANFSQQFEIILKIFSEQAVQKGERVSKAGLAKFLGVSMGKLQKWEEGQIPKPDDLQMLHHTFGFSYEWLITGVGDPYGKPAQPPMPDQKETMTIMADKMATLEAQLAVMQQELSEERALNRKLTTRLLVDGTTDEKSVTDIAKGAGQE